MDILSHLESLSTEDLYKHIDKVQAKINVASRLPSASGAVPQLMAMVEAARQVLIDRMRKDSFENLLKTTKNVIVTDPSEQEAAMGSSKQQPNKSKEPIKRIRIQRSDKPLSQINLAPSPNNEDNQ